MTATAFRYLLIACLLVLSACQKAPGQDAAAAPAGAGPSSLAEGEAEGLGEALPPPPELGEFKIVSVLLGNALDADGIVARDSDTLGRKDTVYASVLSTGPHAGLRLDARWLAPDGSVVAETQKPLVPTGAMATSFSIANPQGWPEGEYELRIAINGSPMQSRKFQVK